MSSICCHRYFNLYKRHIKLLVFSMLCLRSQKNSLDYPNPVLVILFLFCCLSAYSEENSQYDIAVNDLKGELGSRQLQVISDRLRSELMKTGLFRVMERNEMASILKEQGFQMTGACDENSCIVEAGQLLGVSHMVFGSIGKIGSIYTMNLRMINVQTGQITATAISDCQCSLEMVLTATTADGSEKLARALISKKHTVISLESIQNEEMSARLLYKDGMVLIPGGEFLMGSESEYSYSDEKPVHKVVIDSFYLDKTEVTQASYAEVMGKTPSYFSNCPKCPVENVSWNEADFFCKKIGKRLPSEAEWEYGARAGTETEYLWGYNKEEVGAYAWYEDNSGSRTNPVGVKKPNDWGLYDMTGNVWEWCNDKYSSEYYRKSPTLNPPGPDGFGGDRVVRGGAWYYPVSSLRSANRESFPNGYKYRTIGFRCAKNLRP